MEQRGEIYWYDTALRLEDGSVIYPDFKIYQPKRRRLVILEHFGMMDNPNYSVNMKDIDRKLDEIKVLDRIDL